MNLSRVIKNIFFILIAVFSGLTFVVTAIGVTSGTNEFGPINNTVESALSHTRTPLMTGIMIAVTNLGSPLVLIIFGFILAIILVLNRDIYDTMLYIVGLALATVAFFVLKNTFGIPRPDYSLIRELGSASFPSGHATISTAFFFITAYSFWSWPKKWSAKITLVTFSIIAGGLICFSRLYLGAHFAVDVLAGIALGLFSVSIAVLVFNLFLSEREWWRRRVKSL